MPATNLNMNWSSVTVTPSGGSAITLDGVTNVGIDRGSSPKPFYGDALKFARVIKATTQTRSISITSGNCAALNSVAIGKSCTIVAVLNDVANETGSGANTITAVNAVLRDKPIGGANNDYAMATYNFDCFGAASDTDPITVTIAS